MQDRLSPGMCATQRLFTPPSQPVGGCYFGSNFVMTKNGVEYGLAQDRRLVPSCTTLRMAL